MSLSQEKVNINEEGVLLKAATQSVSKESAALDLEPPPVVENGITLCTGLTSKHHLDDDDAAKSDFHQEKCKHNDIIIIGAASADHDSSSSSSSSSLSLPPGQECFPPSNPSSIINNNFDPGLETNVAVEEVSYSLTHSMLVKC